MHLLQVARSPVGSDTTMSRGPSPADPSTVAVTSSELGDAIETDRTAMPGPKSTVGVAVKLVPLSVNVRCMPGSALDGVTPVA
jgi:hypothetical protein